MKVKSIVKGSILSEFQVYTVESVGRDETTVKTTGGDLIALPNDYVEKFTTAANFFKKVEKVTNTEMSNLVLNNPRVAMSVNFTKKGKVLSDRAYNQKIAEISDKFKNAKVKDIEALVDDLVNNPPSKEEPGEERTMVGLSLGKLNAQGRIEFLDMEASLSGVPKQVDPRTIKWVILDEVKYEQK